ncbi:MAG: LruC domain-containing protein [Prolixibacteraceae bacterium]
MKRSIGYPILIVFLLLVSLNRVNAYDTSGYTSITGTNKNIDATSSANKFIIPAGQNWSGGITINNSVTLSLIIEGTANISWISLKNKAFFETIIGTTGTVNGDKIREGGNSYRIINYSNSLTLSAIGGSVQNFGTITGGPNLQIYNNTEAVLENHGTLNITYLQINRNLFNYGSINATGNLDVNSTATLENKAGAVINVGGDFKIDKTFLNNGKTTISGSLNVNSTATLENSCSIIVSANMKSDKKILMKEGSFLKVIGNSVFNSSAILILEKDAYIKTMNITSWSNNITGPAEGHALTQYFGTFNGYKESFDGNIYLVDSQGKMNDILVNYSIAKSECNGDGYAVVEDADGDGISDSQDDFPNDPARSLIAYYPAEDAWNTLLFEDQWPGLGDYDFNDLVIKYQYEYYINADNKVVDLIAHFKVIAAGAGYANGFGFKLSIPNASVLDVSGYIHSGTSITLNANKTEQGSSNEAVVIVFDNLATSLGTMFNVKQGGATKEVTPIDVHVSLSEVDPNLLNTIDPFLFVNQVRGREVHQMGFNPTSKADISLFGTGNDNSNGGVYYRSTQRLPWCLNISGDIRHMIETIDFGVGYPDFIKWTESGGTQYMDWYLTNLYTPVLY